MVAFDELVGANLRRRVRGLALERVFLIDGCVDGRAVGLGRGGVNDPPSAEGPGRLHNVESPFDIRPNVARRGDVGVRYGDQCSEMKNYLLILHRRVHEGAVLDVPRDDPKRGLLFGREQLRFPQSLREV